MYTRPSIDDLLEGVIVSLQNDVMPAVGNPKAQATVGMMQAVLQQVRQTLPQYEALLIDEHNAMTRVLKEVAAMLGETPGPDADRIRERANTLGARPDYPEPVDKRELSDAHFACSAALTDTIVDLDALQRQGNTKADEALEKVRAHLAPRYVRDVQVMSLGAGMVGRN
jgi:hypothetical protein